MASKLLNEQGIEYFVMPNDVRTAVTIGVPEHAWPDLVRALESQNSMPPIYVGVEVTGRNGRVGRGSRKVQSKAARSALRSQAIIGLFRAYAFDNEGGFYGRPLACQIEKWGSADDGAWIAPRRNAWTTYISREWQNRKYIDVLGVRAPSLVPFAKSHAFEVEGEIDVVYMWVDGSDPDWRRRRQSLEASMSGTSPDSIDLSRFRDNGELRYSLRSVEENCPWVRNIILVTDGQVPPWVDFNHPKIRLVTHQDMFGDAGRLPTFNSHAIAGRIHHIDGLSDRYLVFNDDLFIARQTLPALFFTANNMAKFFLSKATIPYGDPSGLTHEAARRNVVDLLEREYGRTVSRTFYHAPVPQLRNFLFELEAKFPEEFEKTWNSQFRSIGDYEINGWLHHYAGFFERYTEPGTIRYDYLDLGDPSFRGRLERLGRRRDVDSFCINDSPSALPENLEFMVEWLDSFYPIPAPWEL